MPRDLQFKMMISRKEKTLISKVAERKGVSKADVMRMAFYEFEKNVQQKITEPKSNPNQEQPAPV